MKASFRLKGGLGPLALALLLSGCGARAYEGGGDSNSNWLKACDPDADCGSGLECLCGICTRTCTSNRACGDDEVATCDVRSTCEQPVAVCTPRGTGATDADTGATRDVDAGKTKSPEDTTGTGTFTADGGLVTTTGTGTGTSPNTDTTGTGTGTSPTNTAGDTRTSPTNTTGTNTGTPTDTPVPEFGDPQCSESACLGEDYCFEMNGRNCVCQPGDKPLFCDGYAYQTLPVPADLQSCVARAASADGSIVVGMCQVVDGPNKAVMWGPSGVEVITSAEYELTQGLGVTDDGLTTIWQTLELQTVVQNNGTQTLLLPNVAEASTPDGSVIVGQEYNGARGSAAFRWTQAGGTQLMQTLVSEERDGALAVSADGETAVGYANTDGGQVPVRWNANGEIEALPLLEGETGGTAHDVSADGSVIVGGSAGGHALRWTSSGVEVLSEVSDGTNSARLVTRDGSRVFGWSTDGAWMWDETNGLQSLEAVLGMNEMWTITDIADVSADGTTIVGSAQMSNDFSPWRWFAFRGRLPVR